LARLGGSRPTVPSRTNLDGFVQQPRMEAVARARSYTYAADVVKPVALVAVIALVGGAAAVLARNGGADAASPGPLGLQVSCVSAGGYRPDASERALARARRLLRTMTITNQMGTVRLTPRTYDVLEVAHVGPAFFGNRPLSRYYHLVKRQCGQLQAERTWMVLVNIGESTVILPPMAILTTPTRAGWKVTLQGLDRSITDGR
jgi:hypothetical protein